MKGTTTMAKKHMKICDASGRAELGSVSVDRVLIGGSTAPARAQSCCYADTLMSLDMIWIEVIIKIPSFCDCSASIRITRSVQSSRFTQCMR